MLSYEQIRQHLDSLAKPPLGHLEVVGAMLCAAQQSLRPATTPRRLVLFAGDGGDSRPELFELILSGRSTSAVLAKNARADLVLVDVGSSVPPFPESPHYRSRKVRSASQSATRPIRIEEFQAAFIVGQKEADQAATDGVRIIAGGMLSRSASELKELLALAPPSQAGWDRLADIVKAEPCVEAAALAGLHARAAELGLVILLDDPGTLGAGLIAEHLYPGTAGRMIASVALGEEAKAALERLGLSPVLPGWNAGDGEGAGALLALPLLDAAAALAAGLPTWDSVGPTVRPAPATPKPQRKVAIFTGTFDPPTTFHRKVARLVRDRGFDEVIVRPTGPRLEQTDGEHAAPLHRAVMADLAFRDLPGVCVDLSDLDEGQFLDDYRFDELYAERGEVWHIISADFLAGGRNGRSAIQTRWENGQELWRNGRFVVLHPTGSIPPAEDLPPVSVLVAADDHVTTAQIRLRVFEGGRASPDVPEAVDAYIRRYRLFSDTPSPRETHIKLDDPRLMIVADSTNSKALSLLEQFRPLESSDPNAILVLGGDGTMLAAIRKHWRRRLPFLGLNAGHLGFLMNETLPRAMAGLELVIYRMPMLRVDTVSPDGRQARALAYADAWVERDTGQAAWLSLHVDGTLQVSRIVGDGLLVATPAGSSAYARAMGSTPVPLSAPVLTLAGSNIFQPRFWRPAALPESAVVRMTNLDGTGRRSIRGFLDGRLIGPVASMEVQVSSIAAVELAFTPQFDLSTRLLRSLFPPSEE